jgi:hypothetical protein
MRDKIKESIENIKLKAIQNQTNDIPFVALCDESKMLLTLAQEKLKKDDKLLTEIESIIKNLCGRSKPAQSKTAHLQ